MPSPVSAIVDSGPKMTVEKIGGKALCRWFTDKAEPQKGYFPIQTLMKVEDDDGAVTRHVFTDCGPREDSNIGQPIIGTTDCGNPEESTELGTLRTPQSRIS
jgi:uncharacterized protein YodC (DUF2158 family)